MIILLGFPKTGTTSFNDFFKKIGYEAYHQHYKKTPIAQIIKNNLNDNKPMLEGFDKNIAITQLDFCYPSLSFFPQITHYEQLYNENKESVFILNKRDLQETLKSFKKWSNLFDRIFTLSPELFINISGINNEEKLLNLFQTHYDNIEKFFSLLPEAKFISYDINKDKLDKLSKYIDIGNETEFPHSNINSLSKHKCQNKSCNYRRHNDFNNNGGTYCCKSCKLRGKHGPYCEQQIYI